uniref:Uncharacterized protein n=1 Tax=Acidianus brierleyi TaxID=41673 RepID=A0A2U9IGN8_9CREN
MMNIVVAFENGKRFVIYDNGVIRETNEEESIFIVKNLDKEKFDKITKSGKKIFICNDNEDICLSKVASKVFGRPKSCKFA